MFVYISSFYNFPIYIYSFNKDRKTDELKTLTEDFKGYLVCDGYIGYDKLREANPNLKIQRCFAHIRRYFYDVVKVLSDKKKKESKASEMVKQIDMLFNLENKMKEENLDPLEIKKRRHSKDYQNVLDSIYTYLHSINPKKARL